MDCVNVCVPGVFDGFDSYGLIACRLVRHLARRGVHANGFGLLGERFRTTPPDVHTLLARPIAPALGAIFLGYPTGYRRHANPLVHLGPRVALTMFESSRCPASWIPVLNRMDAVITPSTFCRDLFVAQGVTVPIHVVPLGVSEVYRPAPRPADRPFTFLAFLDRGERKGAQIVEQAFLRAFGDDTDYRLIFKSRTPRVPLTYTNPNIFVVQRDMDEAELYQLYLECDVLVAPTTGEGFGLIPREFAATGGISLATHWSGTADDIDLWGVPLDYELARAHWRGHEKLEGQDLGVWARVPVEHVAERMRMVAEQRDAYRARGYAQAERVAAAYDWDTFAGRVWAIWKEAYGEHSVSAVAA